MPTYVYRCPKCSRETVQVRNYDVEVNEEDMVPDCEHCKVKMIRSWNDTPVHFKGKGYYSTESKEE